MGVLLTSFGIGAFVGPSLGGVILTAVGSYWLVFWVAGASSVVVGVHQLLSYVRGGQGRPEAVG